MKLNIDKLMASSAGDGSLSLTIKGILIGLIPMIIIVGKFFQISFTETELMNIFETFAAIVSGIIICIGLARKIYYKIARKNDPQDTPTIDTAPDEKPSYDDKV